MRTATSSMLKTFPKPRRLLSQRAMNRRGCHIDVDFFRGNCDLWPTCPALADRPALELVLRNAVGHIAGSAGHCMTALPASDLNVSDTG